MKKLWTMLGVLSMMIPQAWGLIAIRHDVADSRYKKMGEAYPSVVRVGANGGDGTLIAAEWVLTAAHVAEGMFRRSGGALEVFVDGQQEGYPVRQTVLHPRFQPMGPHDIALLRLGRPVERVTPAGLYRGRDEKGQAITLVGHGDTKPGTGGDWVRDGIRRGSTNLVDDVSDTHIVFDFDPPERATELEGTAGPGDSGGPAFIEVDGSPLVAGVSSMGQPGVNGPGTYGAREHYVRVSSHLDWIDSVLAHPPEGTFVNAPPPDTGPTVRRMVRGGAGSLPPGVVLLEEIGLLVQDRDGRVQMVGRVDQSYPQALLDGGIRPPAVVTRLNGEPVASARDLKSRFEALARGARFSLEFDHQGKLRQFELEK